MATIIVQPGGPRAGRQRGVDAYLTQEGAIPVEDLDAPVAAGRSLLRGQAADESADAGQHGLLVPREGPVVDASEFDELCPVAIHDKIELRFLLA